MKIIFVGPSLPDAADRATAATDIRAPAAKGDVYRAVEDGASVIGLIDGYFEQIASVWHKEILYALSRQITVYGAASMGALRAVECAPFGMIGTGKIFERYRSEASVDDADVAQIHGPPDTGYIAVSEPLVNVVFTLENWTRDLAVSRKEADALIGAADKIYFKDRTWRRVISTAELAEGRRTQLFELLRHRKVNQKRLDALELLRLVNDSGPYSRAPRNWTFQATSQWKAATSSG